MKLENKNLTFKQFFLFKNENNFNEKVFVENYEQRKKNYNFLKKKINFISTIAANELKKIHQTHLEKKFFKKLIYIWLCHYIPYNFLIWQRIKKIIKLNKKIDFNIFDTKKDDYRFYDTLDFIDAAHNNIEIKYQSTKKILQFLKKENKKNNKINFFYKKKNINFKFTSKRTHQSNLLLKLLNIYEKLFHPITKKNKIYFKEGLKFSNILKINFLCKQFPNFYFNKFNYNQIKYNFFKKKKLNLFNKLRDKKIKKKLSNCSFENFILENLISDIPICYLEEFTEIYKKSKTIDINPKIVFSSHSHFYNELFKCWIFSKKPNEVKYYVIQHGGNHQTMYPAYDYEKIISFKKFEWIKDKKNNIPIKIIPTVKYSHKSKNKIYFVCSEIVKFPTRIYPGKQFGENYNSIDEFINIKTNLNDSLSKNLHLLPNFTLSSEEQKKLEKYKCEKKILPNLTLKKYLGSGLMLCSYPQTAFIECLMSGPTILLHDKLNWKSLSIFEKDYRLLKKNNIIFEDVDLAIKFINSNYDNFVKNWYLKKNQRVISNFLSKFNFEKKNNFYKKYEDFF